MSNGRERYRKQMQYNYQDRSLEEIVRHLEVEGSETRTKVDLITEKLSDLSDVIRNIGPSLENALKARAAETDRKFDHVWDKIESNKPNWANWIVILFMMFGVGGTLVAFKSDSVIEPIVVGMENQQQQNIRLETKIDEHANLDGHPVSREKIAAIEARLNLHNILLTKVDKAVDTLNHTQFEREDADALVESLQREQKLHNDYKDRESEWVQREFELRTRAQESENKALRAEMSAYKKTTESSVEQMRNNQKAVEDFMLWNSQSSRK